MSSTSDSQFSSSDKLLEGVDVYDGWFEKSGCCRRGDEGAEDGTEGGIRRS